MFMENWNDFLTVSIVLMLSILQVAHSNQNYIYHWNIVHFAGCS